MIDEEEPLLGSNNENNIRSAVHRSDEHGDDSRHGLGEQFDNVPKTKRKLGLFSASLLVFNRIVGTGIFATPSLILRASGSVGVALCMWLAGAAIAAVGTAVYIELGTGLPRNGGEKNYLEYIYRKPTFLVTCVFAVYAVITGSSAANSLVFSEYALHALGISANPLFTRLGALFCLTFCATVQGTNVRLGLLLQNSLGVFKLFLLSFVALVGMLSLFGILPHILPPSTEYPLPIHPFDHPFAGSTGDVSALVSGMYNVIWSFVGYSTANYALSEVRNPVWTIKRAAPIALSAVTVVYILVNIAYFAVVEKQDILSGRRIVAALFFRNLFGDKTERILSVFIALSTLGNLLSGQFSQGRIIQELGREGVVPFSSFFASSKPLGGPLAALSFQWALNVSFMMLPPEGDAYLFMISLSSYCLSLINTLVAFGVLLLSSPLQPYSSYKWDPPFKAHKLVVMAFLLSNLFLVTIPFVPPREGGRTYENLPYYAHALTSLMVSLIGVIYWYIWSRWLPHRKGKEYTLEREWIVGDDGVGRQVFRKFMPAGLATCLGLNELQFYHRGHVLQGSTDSLQEVSFEVDPETVTISENTVRTAWIATKCRFPLLGARVAVVGLEDKDVRFVVELDRIRDVKPGEILWSSISSAEDATDFVDKLINEKRILDDVYLVRVFILKRLDRANCYHILVHAAHCVVDGMSYYSIMRFLLETLSTTGLTLEENIRSRLALSIPSEDLFPVRKSSLARQRWHRAIGLVIYNVRSQNQTGGHALPGTYTTNLILKPARSSSIFTQLTAVQSTAVTSACRKHGFTFGNAYPIIGQMAMARVLSRHYSQGLISEEEWQWRRSQPMWAAGPLNLRPYLNQDWYRQGGADTAMLAIGFFFYRIPFMPLRLNKEGSVPTFNALLSRQRFIHRCLMMKKQANVYLKHPLFLEVVAARFPAMLQDIKGLYAKRDLPFEDHLLDQQEMGKTGLVIAMGGSSIGRIDGMLPRNYPLNKSTPSIKIISTATRLRCRPGEIYLGASSYENIMTLNVFWDSNVTDRELVEEWLSEVKNATIFYLGGEEHTAKL